MVSGSLALLYFLLGFHGGRQGSGPDRGQSPVEWGDFPFVRPYVRLYIHPSIPPSGPSSQAWLAGPQAWLAGPQAGLDGPEGGTDGRRENLPILQDFFPYWVRCPKKNLTSYFYNNS